MSSGKWHRGDRDGRYRPEDQVAPDVKNKGIAPGKLTLTMSLPSCEATTPRSVQTKTTVSSPSRAADAPVHDWTNVVYRPDVSQKPILRAGVSEIGTFTPQLLAEPRPAQCSPVAESSTTSGAPMPADVQTKMENAFDTDFSAVRIHEGSQAQSLRALAYTQGTDIYFAPGEYNPHGRQGQELLGHELAHVVQQSQGRVRATTQAKGMPVNDDPVLEQEADEMGARAARGEPVNIGRQAPRGAIERMAPRPMQRKANSAQGLTDTECGLLESPEEAAEIGREALANIGYEQLIKMAVEAGLLRAQAPNASAAPVQRQAAAGALTFGEAFAPWLTGAGVTSQLDSPAPGPADLAALGVLAIGLVVAGVTVMMSSPGNQADTGIMQEVQALIAAGTAATVCVALQLLMDQARRAGDKSRMTRIKTTQKAKGCRRSRHS